MTLLGCRLKTHALCIPSVWTLSWLPSLGSSHFLQRNSGNSFPDLVILRIHGENAFRFQNFAICDIFLENSEKKLKEKKLRWQYIGVKTSDGDKGFFLQNNVCKGGDGKKVDYFVETQNILLILGLPSPTIYQINGNFMRIPQNFTKLR